MAFEFLQEVWDTGKKFVKKGGRAIKRFYYTVAAAEEPNPISEIDKKKYKGDEIAYYEDLIDEYTEKLSEENGRLSELTAKLEALERFKNTLEDRRLDRIELSREMREKYTRKKRARQFFHKGSPFHTRFTTELAGLESSGSSGASSQSDEMDPLIKNSTGTRIDVDASSVPGTIRLNTYIRLLKSDISIQEKRVKNIREQLDRAKDRRTECLREEEEEIEEKAGG